MALLQAVHRGILVLFSTRPKFYSFPKEIGQQSLQMEKDSFPVGKRIPIKWDRVQKFAISLKKTPREVHLAYPPSPPAAERFSNWIIPLEILCPLPIEERKAFDRKESRLHPQKVFFFIF